MELAADQMVDLWQKVQNKALNEEAFFQEEQRLLLGYRQIWERALLLQGHKLDNLLDCFFFELGTYLGGKTKAEVQEWHKEATLIAQAHWRDKVRSDERQSVERYYNECEIELYNLSYWHTLTEDLSPLAYVTALKFAQQRGCRTYLDFGAGVGSGAILFAREGFEVALAEISSPSLQYSRWRMNLRHLPATFLDLKDSDLPADSFDVVTAMDVFEHLVDPVEAVGRVWSTLKRGGYLFGRFDADPHDTHTTHVVRDFTPTFERMRELGLVEVWQDKWFWGHRAFQKR